MLRVGGSGAASVDPGKPRKGMRNGREGVRKSENESETRLDSEV
jgi:hypothetical protein